MDGNGFSLQSPQGERLRLPELLGALSYALDLTEGQLPGHCVRCCWIGMQIGRRLGLDEKALRDLYYTLLLKDLGCSSNAARICQLYRTDDLDFKHDFKEVDESLPQVLRFVLHHTGVHASTAERLRSILHVFQDGSDIARELIETRCQRGAQVALQMRFSRGVADGILNLDEHWDGSGHPSGLSGEAIPINARIALLAQVADVFLASHGSEGASREVHRRSGSWFEPRLVQAFDALEREHGFWRTLFSSRIDAVVFALEPARDSVALDDGYLDDIAAAFGQIVDAKSPFTSGHSARVALVADQLAARLGLDEGRRRWLRRGALLHDLGKLGVSNSILDKPGPLSAEEWEEMRYHATLTGEILSRIEALSELARVAAAHHERLDGTGYPLRQSGDEISLETRIITTADIFDALTADRPYRKALAPDRALQILRSEADKAIDRRCLRAIEEMVREARLPQAGAVTQGEAAFA
jgi:putative nucleotidyltransferase with HDIG domain